MNERDAITHYTPPQPSIVDVGVHRVRAFVGNATPAIGSTLFVGDIPARIVKIAGNCRVEASIFDAQHVHVGQPVRCDPRPAAWPTPRLGATALAELNFLAGHDASVSRNSAQSAPIGSGIAILDELLPLASSGTTMILDSGAPAAAVASVLRWMGTPLVVASPRKVDGATHQIIGAGLAVEVAVAWAAQLGAALYVESEFAVLDDILDNPGLSTVVLRMYVHDGLEVIAETLHAGQSDTQIFLRDDGTIDLARSQTRLPVSSPLRGRLGALPDIRERLAIFGIDDTDPEDVQYLRAIEALERGLIEVSAE